MLARKKDLNSLTKNFRPNLKRKEQLNKQGKTNKATIETTT